VGLLNPHGPMLYVHVLRLAGNPNVADMREWQPLDWGLAYGDHWHYLASLLLLGVSLALSPRWASPTQLLLVVAFAPWPLWQRRMLLWWAVLVPWVVLLHWAAVGARLRWPWLHAESVLSFRKTLAVGLIVVVLLLWWGPVQMLLRGRPRPLDTALTPGTPWRLAAQLNAPPDSAAPPLPDLARALADHYGGRFRGAIFASETQGDYLLWALPAEYPVLLYSHVHLFAPAYWQECMTVKRGGPGWRAALDRRGVNLVVVEADLHPSLCGELRRDPDWLVVLDQAGGGGNPANRLFVALRKVPKQ